eukprot:4002774-Prymnesium_polylepis.1
MGSARRKEHARDGAAERRREPPARAQPVGTHRAREGTRPSRGVAARRGGAAWRCAGVAARGCGGTRVWRVRSFLPALLVLH